MPVPRDSTMPGLDRSKVIIAMAAAKMEPKDGASESIRTMMQE